MIVMTQELELQFRKKLQNEETDEPAQPVGASATVDTNTEPIATPAVETTVTTENETSTESPAQATASGDAEPTETSILCPPPYNVATDLPSYEEAERTKQEEAARREQEAAEAPRRTRINNSIFARLLSSDSTSDRDSQLGTDGMFLCTFLFAFVFNWIGLLGSLCITQTIAGRLGAMSGFGLSLVKWVAIVKITTGLAWIGSSSKHSNWAAGISEGDSWLWWLLIIMGFLIFLRGCTQYLRIKYHWSRLNQNVRNNIFYYF